MSAEKYNGWTNYETWNYALWLDNDEYSQSACNEQAQECYDAAEADKTFSRVERATLDLAEQLKAGCEENAEAWMPDQASCFADAINSYISAINWYEIASHYVDEIETEQAA